MEKNQIKIIVDQESYYDDQIEISSFMDLIKEAADGGATHVRIGTDFESNDVDIDFYYYRPETDEELDIRMKRIESYEKGKEERERKEFERLKQKFGPNK